MFVCVCVCVCVRALVYDGLYVCLCKICKRYAHEFFCLFGFFCLQHLKVSLKINRQI